MRLGLALPNASPEGRPLTGPALIAGTRAVERAGFDSLWCFDSIGRGSMIPDPLIAVSVAATVTERLTRSEEHTSELQSLTNLVCRLLLEKKKKQKKTYKIIQTKYIN